MGAGKCKIPAKYSFHLRKSYFSTNISGLSGDIHFDDDEQFTTGTSEGINLDWVAVHEFGHSLGLEHTNVRESIMYPWYKGYFPNIELTEDDIFGIQALHGKQWENDSQGKANNICLFFFYFSAFSLIPWLPKVFFLSAGWCSSVGRRLTELRPKSRAAKPDWWRKPGPAHEKSLAPRIGFC